MTLIRWNPGASLRDLDTFHDEVNRLFDGFLTPLSEERTFVPATDIEETADSYRLRIDLPGMEQKDVKVTMLGETLTIRGERKAEDEETSGNVYRRERRYGAFERAFRLGQNVKPEQVKATFRNGVLEVTVPKADEARSREIQIQVQ